MQEIIRQWMVSHAKYAESSIDLAGMAVDRFPNVIGINTFVWNDAQSIWDYRCMVEVTKHYG
jgi:hypothetical protein